MKREKTNYFAFSMWCENYDTNDVDFVSEFFNDCLRHALFDKDEWIELFLFNNTKAITDGYVKLQKIATEFKSNNKDKIDVFTKLFKKYPFLYLAFNESEFQLLKFKKLYLSFYAEQNANIDADVAYILKECESDLLPNAKHIVLEFVKAVKTNADLLENFFNYFCCLEENEGGL